MTGLPFAPVADNGTPAPLRKPAHIALLGNFPPRHCGLATYTFDSYQALLDLPRPPKVDVYAMDDGQVSGYPAGLAGLIDQDDYDAYVAAARAINASGAEMLWIQHEFGIFGGKAGSHVLGLVNGLDIPFALTLHTILETPDADQKRITAELVHRAAITIVMADKGREILVAAYPDIASRVVVIPHGAPDRPLEPACKARARLGLAERPTLLTFGLLSPDKGIADLIEALPEIRRSSPDVHYIVLGATHPHLKRREGERFRYDMMERVDQLGLSDNVTFIDRYTAFDELMDWLGATDIYVTPYLNRGQITSGTLSYAIALGKPVVSTPYIHACEILADDHGVLVPFRSPADLAKAISGLLTDRERLMTLSERAYERGRSMIWARNAEAAMDAMALGLRIDTLNVFQGSRAHMKPVLQLAPIERLTDGTGMLQHSVLGIADRVHGYCIDDNARALMLMAIAEDLPVERRQALSATYASFIQHGWNAERRCYRNFMAYDRSWLEQEGSEDSNGRTLWALGTAARRLPGAAQRDWALKLFGETAELARDLTAPRARAFCMFGALEILGVDPMHVDAATMVEGGADMLAQLLQESSRPDWAWFEIILSYDNARLPEALIRAGLKLGRSDYVGNGLEALRWVAERTTDRHGYFRPVGTDSFAKPHAPPAMFDQQPLEAWAMIDACAAAWQATRDAEWIDRASCAHQWFLGANVLGQPLIDPETGECYDGLTPSGVNLNHGAESVLAWQFAHRRYSQLISDAKLPNDRTAAIRAA
jgi:glycosyltransferase involved in cell wall biosynthesis